MDNLVVDIFIPNEPFISNEKRVVGENLPFLYLLE